jgi:hypothetical protein
LDEDLLLPEAPADDLMRFKGLVEERLAVGKEDADHVVSFLVDSATSDGRFWAYRFISTSCP